MIPEAVQVEYRYATENIEYHFVILFGGLHIEMAALRNVGDLLDSSGWTGALVQACVVASGTADSFMKAAHVACTRQAHQVTVSSLYLLLQKAFSQEAGEGQDLEDWSTEHVQASPQFHFWGIILHLD